MPTFTSLLTRRASLLALLVFPLVASAFAQPPEPNRDHELVPFAPAPLALATILARHGPPSQRVGADLWVYWNFPIASAAAKRAGYDTLIVRTDGEFARTARLVRAADLRALLHQIGRANQVADSARRPWIPSK